MFKRQRDITPPTSDDEEPRRRLVDYSDTESSDDEEDEDLTSYYSIKTVKEKKSRLFQAQGKNFSSTSRLSLTMFRHISLYPDCLIGW